MRRTFDGDCDVDLFVTHLATETNTLYVNRGGWFSDDTNRAGLAASSGPYTGFGTGWFDADNDGDLDIFSANGAVFPVEAQRLAGDAYPLRQRNQLWLNDGEGRYREHRTVEALQMEEVSRGAAFADLDNDGDIDIVGKQQLRPTPPLPQRRKTNAVDWPAPSPRRHRHPRTTTLPHPPHPHRRQLRLRQRPPPPVPTQNQHTPTLQNPLAQRYPNHHKTPIRQPLPPPERMNLPDDDATR